MTVKGGQTVCGGGIMLKCECEVDRKCECVNKCESQSVCV